MSHPRDTTYPPYLLVWLQISNCAGDWRFRVEQLRAYIRKKEFWGVIPPQSSITQYIWYNDLLRKSNAPSSSSRTSLPFFVLDSPFTLVLLHFLSISDPLSLSLFFDRPRWRRRLVPRLVLFSSPLSLTHSFSRGGSGPSLKTGNHHYITSPPSSRAR